MHLDDLRYTELLNHSDDVSFPISSEDDNIDNSNINNNNSTTTNNANNNYNNKKISGQELELQQIFDAINVLRGIRPEKLSMLQMQELIEFHESERKKYMEAKVCNFLVKFYDDTWKL